MLAKIYKIQLKRKGIIINEVFVGNRLKLWLYMFKMRKWKIKIIN